MRIYVFGNEDLEEDNVAFKVADKISREFPGIEFIKIKPNQDINFDGEQVLLMDVVEGIGETTILDEKDLDKITLSPRMSAHDFDLGFQLKYLKKLGKLEKIKTIGLPMKKKINYERIQLIFKKLVAQDMQGS